MIYHVQVGVALGRPPTLDEYRLVTVEARDSVEASLLAAQIASCTSVMAVSATVIGDGEVGIHDDDGGTAPPSPVSSATPQHNSITKEHDGVLAAVRRRVRWLRARRR